MLKSLEADLRRLPVTLVSYSRPVGDNGGSEVALAEDFRDSPLEAHTWTTLGNIRTSTAGLQLAGTSDGGAAPYLITKDQYDPTLGPVTIVCDVRFQHVGELDVPSFSILTRSAAERTDMERPWSDILATCVRCNFRSTADEFDGLLEISTKYERDRELTGLSWRGFRRPQPGVLYRLVMRDDGVNVSFTVTQVDKPTITKTVVCRSLFRGYQNHIALEGWNQGTVVVEKLNVYQDLASNRTSDHFARFGFATSQQSPAAHGSQNPLRAHIPRDARLLVEDDFEQATLDHNLWAVLGDVSVDGGKVSLGQGAANKHIDTFHPRPYLLTKQRFSTSDGDRYVLGKIEFDDNFLQGYGGSFAILSRCADHYGDGPEWAVSALSTGIRCNLWPAAPQADHNLEIHEKPTAATLSFVRGSALAIDPLSRCYYFLLEDSGEEIAVTFQDANDPTVVGIIRHRPSPHAPRTGFIGFESTWGSRVQLDDVKIYVAQPTENAP